MYEKYQVLHSGMGPAILKHLSAYAPIENLMSKYPGVSEVFIAGQAVASALSELFYDGKCVAYNDIDAFFMSNQFLKPENQIITTLNFSVLEVVSEYASGISIENVSVYEVCSTAREGLLNEVHCTPLIPFNGGGDIASKMFVGSFDLNCVQVGIRLSDKALVWSPAFEQFLRAREMLVINVKTPVHTAIRWLKKKQELEGIYGHDDNAMELLTAAYLQTKNRGATATTTAGAPTNRFLKTIAAQMNFGKQYADKAVALGSSFSKYFEVTSITSATIPVYGVIPKQAPRLLLETNQYSSAELPVYARALQGHWKKHQCELVISALQHAKGGSLICRANLVKEGIQAIKPFKGLTALDQFKNIFAEHAGLSSMACYLNTTQQLAVLAALKKRVAQQGVWIYGLAEKLYLKDWAELQEVAVADIESQFKQLIDNQLQGVAAQEQDYLLRARVLPSLSFEGFRVAELVTFKDLIEESGRMHHCVAGYFQAVMSGHCRIFRFQKPKSSDSLTLELKPHARGLSLVQLRGLLNRNASDEEVAIVHRFVQVLNAQWLIKESLRLQVPLPVLNSVLVKVPLISKFLRARQAIKSPWKHGLRLQILMKFLNITRHPVLNASLNAKVNQLSQIEFIKVVCKILLVPTAIREEKPKAVLAAACPLLKVVEPEPIKEDDIPF